MKDQLRPAQGFQCLFAQQTVRIRNQPDPPHRVCHGLLSPHPRHRGTKVTSFSYQANSLILVREPDENRSATDPASHVASAEIAGRRTAVSFRPPTKGGCVARGTPRLDRRSHPSGGSPLFLVCPKQLTCF